MKYKCKKCSKEYDVWSSLRAHESRKHIDPDKISAAICGCTDDQGDVLMLKRLNLASMSMCVHLLM